MLCVIQTVNDVAMLTRFFSLVAFSLFMASQALAVELIMVEQKGCHYCQKWLAEIGPIYPKTPEGAFAPLRLVNIADGPPADVHFARKPVFTPTFILVDEGKEIGRIEGYPGEDFFWGLLEMMLRAKTSYVKPDGAAASN